MENNIIKILDLKDDDLIVTHVADRAGKRILSIERKLIPTFCPHCGARMHSKGIYIRHINHPILQNGMQLELLVRQRRWKCPNCGYTANEHFSFVEPNRRVTSTTDMMIVMAFKDPGLSAMQIAERFHVSDTYAITLFARYVEMPRRNFTEIISIDEVYTGFSATQKYAMVITDFITGEPIDLLISRRKDITEPYFASIPYAERATVKYLLTDMYKPYIAFIDRYFPNAKSVVDSFHVMQIINSKLLVYMQQIQRELRIRDLQRHAEQEQVLGHSFNVIWSKEYYLIKKYKWLILTNNRDLDYSAPPRYNRKFQRYMSIGDLERMLFEIDPSLSGLRDLKEMYVEFNQRNVDRPKNAAAELKVLIEIYRESDYSMFREIATTLSQYQESIVNSFILADRYCRSGKRRSRLSNGPIESLNRITKDLKRQGRGYGNFAHLRNRFLFATRENATVLGTPRSLEEVTPGGAPRGHYMKSSKSKK